MHRRVKLKLAALLANLLVFVLLQEGTQVADAYGYDLENTFETEVNSLVELEKRTLRSLGEPVFSAQTVPGPAKGINKVFLEEALKDIKLKRSYAVALDSCYIHLDYIRRTCEDNNSTLTKRDCFTNCVPKQTGDICYRLWEPEMYGETNIMVEKRWYFDQKTNSCLQFDYGGCLGNSNNHINREDCQLQNNLEVANDLDRFTRYSLQDMENYGECSLIGHAHFNTFDNKTYTFYGKCDYVLAEVRNEQNTRWKIVLVSDRYCDPRKS